MLVKDCVSITSKNIYILNYLYFALKSNDMMNMLLKITCITCVCIAFISLLMNMFSSGRGRLIGLHIFIPTLSE